MNDSCVCVDVDDGPEFYSDTMPTARKEHKCGECREIIRVGEKYEKCVGVWDGSFNTHKTCMPCVHIRSEYFECGWNFGAVWEDLANAWDTTTELLLTGKDDDDEDIVIRKQGKRDEGE